MTDAANASHLNQIIRIDLSRLKLKVLPPEIGCFTQLRVLTLFDNQLSDIPSFLATFTQLQELSLFDNQFRKLPSLEGLTRLRELYLNGNPWMFIEDNELKRFRRDFTIRQFQAQLRYVPQTPLAHLYHAIISRKQIEEIQGLFSQLSQEDKDLVYEKVWILSGKIMNSDLRWGEHHVYDDRQIFYHAVQEAIFAKYARFSDNEKEDANEKVCELSTLEFKSDFDLIDHIPQLADVLALT